MATITLNGVTVNATPSEIAEILKNMNSAPTLPTCVDYSTNGLESNGNISPANTPAMPKNANAKAKTIKTKYEVFEDEVDGKKVYRIKSGAYTAFKGGSYARKAINAKIKELADIITGTFKYTDKDGVEHEYSGWYYTNKKTADKMLKVLPESVEW